MGKTGKKSATKVAAAAVQPAKFTKKGKREAEEALEKLSSAKKQKIDQAKVEAAQKKEEMKRQAKQKTLQKKKDETSSSEESDSTEDEKMVKQVTKKPQTVAKPALKESSSDESSSDEQPAPKKQTIASNKVEAADDSDASEDDSDDDKKSVPAKKVSKRVTVAKANGSVPASKKDESNDGSEDESSDSDDEKGNKVPIGVSEGASKKDESSESDESDSDSEEDACAEKPVAKSPKKAESEDTSSESESEDEAPATKNVTVAKRLHETGTKESQQKKMDIDESESDDDSSDVDEPQNKKSKLASQDAKPNVNAAQKESGSEDSSDESEESSDDELKTVQKSADATSEESDEDSSSESEDERPLDIKKKGANVEMMDASPVTAHKPAAPKHDKKAATPLSGETKTIFVGNLPYSAEKSDLETFFKDVGEVVDVRFSVAADDGRRRGFGHVEFASAEQARKAVELNGEFLNDRALKIDIARERGSYIPASKEGNYSSYRNGGSDFAGKVFVKGFDTSGGFDQIRTALEEQFSACGEVSNISIPKDFESGEPKGVAFVCFKDTDGFNKALELNGTDIGGYPLVVEEARPRDSDGPGSGRGRGRGRDGGRFSDRRGRGSDRGGGRGSFNRQGRGGNRGRGR